MLGAGSALFVRHHDPVTDEHDVVAALAHGRSAQVAFVPLLRPAALTHVHATFGQFSASASIPRSALRKAVGASERHNPGVVLSDVEISAHVVAQAIVADRPLVQAMCFQLITVIVSEIPIY